MLRENNADTLPQSNPGYVIAYDVGTSSLKTCMYKLGDTIQLSASHSESYELHFLENGGVEQDPHQWWDAMKHTTGKVLNTAGVPAKEVQGITFCAQMQGLVLIDDVGEPVRPAMNYLDSRAEAEMQRVMGSGFKIDGINIFKLIQSISRTGVVATSAKDPVWKYLWVKNHEPEVFAKVYKWLDVKDYLVARASGCYTMTEDSAFASMLFDIHRRKFSPTMCRMFGIDPTHLPELANSTSPVGTLTAKAASELGLLEGTNVYGGGGDASLLGVGAGATELHDTHMYLGTSGWVSTVVEKPLLDIKNRIAGIVGADASSYNYFAELETAGKCVEWVRDHLAFDEFNDYLAAHGDVAPDLLPVNLYTYMMDAIDEVPAGSNGVIFAPWLHGNRSPFEDPNARGVFFNLGINNGKRDMIHAVIEGVCFHLKWQLEASEVKVQTSDVIRLVGGGALSDHTCQTLADVLGRPVEVVAEPQNAGALGAVLLVAVAIGMIQDISLAKSSVEIAGRFEPDPQHKSLYTEQFQVFKNLYRNNRKAFMFMNQRIHTSRQ